MSDLIVHHADHGVSPAQLEHIVNELRAEGLMGFFIRQVDLPPVLGTLPNALWGPACGDGPVGDDEVEFVRRGGRPWADRMCVRPTRPCFTAQAIGIAHADGLLELFTVYGGPLAPQHPDDPSNQDPEASRAFWAVHALAAGDLWPSVACTVEHPKVVEIQKLLDESVLRRLGHLHDCLHDWEEAHGTGELDGVVDALEVVGAYLLELRTHILG